MFGLKSPQFYLPGKLIYSVFHFASATHGENLQQIGYVAALFLSLVHFGQN